MVLRRLTPQRVLCPCTLLHRASFIAPPAILSITSVSDRSTSPHALSIKIIRSMLKRMNSWAGVSRAGARTGLQLPGHGDMHGVRSPFSGDSCARRRHFNGQRLCTRGTHSGQSMAPLHNRTFKAPKHQDCQPSGLEPGSLG